MLAQALCFLALTAPPAASNTTADMQEAAKAVRFIHGSPAHGIPGPWALLGHRMGLDALQRLHKSREQSWDLLITHRAPAEVKYTCMVDGLQASTGTSAGKLNLRHETIASAAHVESLVRDKKSGRTLRYKPSKAFVEAFNATDYADFPAAAEELFAKPLEHWANVFVDSDAPKEVR